MLADLSELHELVTKTLDTSWFPMDTLSDAKQFSVRKHIPFGVLSIRDHLILLHLLVQLRLERTHPNLNHLLDLIRQLGLDILLETTQQEGSKHLMQTTNDEERLFFVQLNLVGSTRVGEGCVEPLIERFHGIEDFGEDEIEEGPKFGKVVLEWSTSQNKTVTGVIELGERLREFTLSVLHTMTLIYKEVSYCLSRIDEYTDQ